MNSDAGTFIYLIGAAGFVLCISFLNLVHSHVNRKRMLIIKRLRGVDLARVSVENLQNPLQQRIVGSLANWLLALCNQVIPKGAVGRIDNKLEKAGRPWGMRASDFLAIEAIIAITTGLLAWFSLRALSVAASQRMLSSLSLTALLVYLPWFMLARTATIRLRDIRKRLPEIMDLLVVSVEAGLSFELALVKVSDKFKGPIGLEFRRVLREIQLGRPRKDAFKDMAQRVNLTELSSFLNAVIQSEQLGVGMGNILRMQADHMREKRQQWIEEQAMKVPVKMIVPLVLFVFPSIFIVILGPAILNIIKVLGGK